MNLNSVLSFITKDTSEHEWLVLAQEKEKLHAANTRNYFPSNIFSTWRTLEKLKNSKIILPLSKCAFNLERSEYNIMHGLSHVYRPWSPYDYWWQEKTLYCGDMFASCPNALPVPGMRSSRQQSEPYASELLAPDKLPRM
jgi:hypothetical protein